MLLINYIFCKGTKLFDKFIPIIIGISWGIWLRGCEIIIPCFVKEHYYYYYY